MPSALPVAWVAPFLHTIATTVEVKSEEMPSRVTRLPVATAWSGPAWAVGGRLFEIPEMVRVM